MAYRRRLPNPNARGRGRVVLRNSRYYNVRRRIGAATRRYNRAPLGIRSMLRRALYRRAAASGASRRTWRTHRARGMGRTGYALSRARFGRF